MMLGKDGNHYYNNFWCGITDEEKICGRLIKSVLSISN